MEICMIQISETSEMGLPPTVCVFSVKRQSSMKYLNLKKMGNCIFKSISNEIRIYTKVVQSSVD